MVEIGEFHGDNSWSSAGWILEELHTVVRGEGRWGQWEYCERLEASEHGLIPSVPWADVFTTVSLFLQLLRGPFELYPFPMAARSYHWAGSPLSYPAMSQAQAAASS